MRFVYTHINLTKINKNGKKTKIKINLIISSGEIKTVIKNLSMSSKIRKNK